ncbi:MAG: hypothetical protein OEQ12_08035, partial [Nitrosopumilus sp.]|nr:hypothetical protein [Nitrosopumilus sp.]
QSPKSAPPDVNTVFESAKEQISPMISPFSKNIVSESNRAVEYIVKISGGDLSEIQTFHTFGKFQPGEDPIFINSLQSQGFSSYFTLESLPTKDKIEFYEIISKYFNPGKIPEPFDVSLDGISGDGSTIVTMNYNKCRISEYLPYLQNFVFIYPLSDTYGPEIRERTIFACQGFNVEVNPENEKVDLSLLNSISDDIRAKKFVVHFFNGELEQVFSSTFRDFSPSVNTLETPFVTITTPGNQFDSSPQFFLESLPSYDKSRFYEFLSRYVNPVKQPEPFDVSVDLITFDNSILQRWNYVDCEVTNYQMSLDDSLLSFSFSQKPQGEIKDKTEFACAGIKLQVQDIHKIDNFPIFDKNSNKISSEELSLLYEKEPPTDNNRAMSYRIHVSDGELEFTRTTEHIPVFQGLVQNRGPLTPIHHDKQYDFGFYVEATPDKDRVELYNFLSRYVNPGKQPDPIDVNVDVLTGDKRVLETLQYSSCTAIDFDWYTQDLSFRFQITNEIQEEIREKFTFYCDGFTINVP